MSGLFTSFEEDLEQFKIIFENPEFRPDSLKIYPTLVIKGTKLYEMWKRGEYEPLEEEKAVELIAKALKYIPKYCRIIRVQRDIPATHIVAGVRKSNLRELVEKRAEELGIKIKEIRYREVGHKLEKGVKID
ncbi:MAG: tRNA uridine(34) 5-carboxymethylaminomethyl modification radical SAM/GNAT enzyme Elp3, partial [Candidatus Aenigmatarchaeota archaeon]